MPVTTLVVTATDLKQYQPDTVSETNSAYSASLPERNWAVSVE